MAKSVVIVESPAKARTIHRFLGRGNQVLASMGHVRDLPERTLGVDVQAGFKPRYVLTPNGKRVIKNLRAAVSDADAVYLATDPDREGEAIAWHLREVLKKGSKAPFHRVSFHEITASAIRAAFQQAGEIDQRKVDAQQARRILDRLVGYEVSPLLWRRVRGGTSAGRVQSVALRLVCEREREIRNFVPEEYWNLSAVFQPLPAGPEFTARLAKLDGAKPRVPDAETVKALAEELERAQFRVAHAGWKDKSKRPPPPFITSTLQQAAGNLLRMNTRRTMSLAQVLYEGVELGPEGAVGLITYMRTDSVAVAKEASEAARRFIGEKYGPEYVPARPNVYRSRKTAQEAHEAIRPTDPSRTPEQVAPYLDRDQLRLYRLIWSRFLASQMAPARLREHTIEVVAEGSGLEHDYLFRATAVQVVFPGFRRVYQAEGEGGETAGTEAQAASALPEVAEGTACRLLDLLKEQKFTEPPPRFTEASLVRELESNGVGRPSTYASIVNTIQERKYVTREKGRLIPTDVGFAVNDFLVQHLPRLFDVGFTARMEEELDEIEEGKVDWQSMLQEFYEQFRKWVSGLPAGEIPAAENAAAFLNAFPEDVPWDPPVARGRRQYDDRKFFESIRSQVLEKQKALSEKQWAALLNLAARYADRCPGILAAAESAGAGEVVRRLMEKRAEAAGDNSDGDKGSPPAAPGEETLRLLAVFEGVQWNPPVKRGTRTYDDAEFFRSLKQQVESGRDLTPAQKEALRKLAVRYRDQIPDFENLASELGISAPAPVSAEALGKVRALFEAAEKVQEWRPPRKRGRGTLDDRKFVESLKRQFEQKGTLSEKQINALARILDHYSPQISGAGNPGEAAPEAAAGGPGPESNGDGNAGTGKVCPECGAPLVLRRGRRGPFLGCSNYPKCRHTEAVSAPAGAKKE